MVMRVANIIIAHKNPLQLERLIRKMQHENFDFYIHIDKKIDIESFLFLKEIKGVFFIKNRVVCNWGGHSTLKAMLNSLKETQANETQYGFYNLLSAQDYPIKKNQEFYEFLLEHQKNSLFFMNQKSLIGGKWLPRDISTTILLTLIFLEGTFWKE